MNWYTKDNGVLCLGTKGSQFAYFNVVTDVIINTKINTALNEAHIAIIGSFPEDWISDSKISNKINKVAKHFFGFSNQINQSVVA